ncbi:MAG TPA: HD domain-containing protein [Candidatus Sumerlaeota bacterium]|nr:MAG: putative hydrolase [candidate division BRC1 bacterium ADurb.Bin183]HOE63840.1 HD domain-containing protein [Candidatus Sumerlaeota bacterium]HRR30991.1 HD domain-containing protein [Candidatus Sumerlaeia bacterium]HON49944.1 HD domain-containing protein [Candidatus Sumerlaeota bacterium]HOR63808.1 HD domain-containing protein [Candidatus Sumerlaeota bacterium]
MEIAYPQIEEAAREAFTDAPPTHDFSHTQRVLNLCMHIGRSEGADLEILYAAALLHDIARKEADEQNQCHAELSSLKAAPILEQAGFPPEKRDDVLHCIATHRFRSDNPPATLEAKVLYDADKLDAIGAIGVCRAYAYGGENGQRLYDSFSPADLESPNTESISKITNHKEHTPIIEFRMKLSRIKDKLFTATARSIAESRHRYMLKFFNRLYEEVNGIK